VHVELVAGSGVAQVRDIRAPGVDIAADGLERKAAVVSQGAGQEHAARNRLELTAAQLSAGLDLDPSADRAYRDLPGSARDRHRAADRLRLDLAVEVVDGEVGADRLQLESGSARHLESEKAIR